MQAPIYELAEGWPQATLAHIEVDFVYLKDPLFRIQSFPWGL